jgi:hypothetical protein
MSFEMSPPPLKEQASEAQDKAEFLMGTSKSIPLWCDDWRSRSQHGRSFNP